MLNRLAVVLVSLIFSSSLLAAPGITPPNKLNTQTVFGPKTFSGGSAGARGYNETFKAPSNADGVITLKNGSGKDLYQEKCTGTVAAKLVCQVLNLAKKLEVALLRASLVEIHLNNKVVIAKKDYNPESGQIQFAIKTLAGTPASSVQNQLKIKVVGSPLATITLETKVQSGVPNQLPIARMTSDVSTGAAPLTVNFSGLQSSDPDGNITSYEWNFGDPASGSNNQATGALAVHTFAAAGNYNVTLTVRDNQGATASVVNRITVVPNTLPVARFTATPESGHAPLVVSLDARASSDAEGSISRYSWSFGDGGSGSGAQVAHTFQNAGQYTVILTVSDEKGAIASVQKIIQVAAPNASPKAVIKLSRNQGIAPLMVEFDGSASTDPDGNIAEYLWDFGNGRTGTGSKITQEFGVGTYTITLTVRDSAGAENKTSVNVTGSAPVLPPDPATVAPALSETEITLPSEMVEFLYTGPNPIQTGVAEGTIDKRHVSVIRGRILQEDGSPLSGAVVKILAQPQFGQTLTREDGQYDLAINGGGTLILSVERNGYYPVQRRVTSSHQAFAAVDDIYMLRPDPIVTVVQTNSDQPQVARGSTSSDEDGTRTARVLIPSKTAASLRMPNGSLVPVSQLSIRAKEYTVGENGPNRMPAELPSTSAYTYAVQLTADEVAANGAKGIEFSKPVAFYVENFLGFPTGDVVPVGYYNLDKGAWEPADNGRVIKILDVVNGKAVLDVTGEGPATTGDLVFLGVDEEELQSIASSYRAGTSLWRAQLNHFSIVDLNWFQEDALPSIDAPKPVIPGEAPLLPTIACGSIIHVDTQNLGETVQLPGTNYSINYLSSNMPGDKTSRVIDIPVTPASLSKYQNLISVDLKVEVAGQTFTKKFSPAPNLFHRYVWDGKDAYGRKVTSRVQVRSTLSYNFKVNYLRTAFKNAFGSVETRIFATLGGGDTISSIPARDETTISRVQINYLSPIDKIPLSHSIGGWNLNIHHSYDPVSRSLSLGDGTKRSAKTIGNIVRTVAGSAFYGYSGDGGRATSAQLSKLTDLTVGPDNSVYFRDGFNARIRKVDPNGIIETIAGTGVYVDGGENKSALDIGVDYFGGIALNTEGSTELYFAESSFNKIKKIDINGNVVLVAGTGISGYSGDGGDAKLARISAPTGIAVKDGYVYFNDTGNNRVRVISPDGIIKTVAGNGVNGYSGDGGPAIQAELRQPFGLSTGPNGDLYLADLTDGRIRRIDRSGTISTVAGGGFEFTKDNIPAIEAGLIEPTRAILGKDGTIYISNNKNRSIRYVTPDGIISTFVGSLSSSGSSVEGEYASEAKLVEPYAVALGADDSVYFVDGPRIKKIMLPFPGVSDENIIIPAEDGSELFVFDRKGKHLETLNALTGAKKYIFGYDANSFLVTVTDGFGNVTTIERRSSGDPVSIKAPYGQVTSLELSDEKYINLIQNEAGERYTISYSEGGLIKTFTKPAGNTSNFVFNVLGQLSKDQNAAGGFTELFSQFISDGYSVQIKTAEGRLSRKIFSREGSGKQTSQFLNSDGIRSDIHFRSNRIEFSNPTTSGHSIAKTEPRLGAAVNFNYLQSYSRSAGVDTVTTTDRSVSYYSDNIFDYIQTDQIYINENKYVQTFDSKTLMRTLKSPMGREINTFVNAHGQVISQQLPGYHDIKYSYNANGKLEAISEGARKTEFLYDVRGRLASVQNPLGQVTTYEYDSSDRAVRMISPDGKSVLTSYDQNGNLVGITPSGRPLHSMTFNLVDLLESYNPPNLGQAQTTQYLYNLDKQLAAIQSPDGSYANYKYFDKSTRLREINTRQGNYSFTYNLSTGFLTNVLSPTLVNTQFMYAGDFLTTVTNSGEGKGIVNFGYDDRNRLSSISINEKNNVSYSYDADDLLITSGPLSFVYNSLNSQMQKTSLSAVVTDFAYNGWGELSNSKSMFSGQNIFESSFVRDALGRIINKSETSQVNNINLSYKYDLSGRLSESTRDGVLTKYSYDLNGNRLSVERNGIVTTATFNEQDQILSYGAKTYSYSTSGSLESIAHLGAETRFNYDIFSNLRSVELPDGRKIDYLIDGLNRRVGKVVGDQRKYWVYESQLRIAAELDANGQVVSRFIYGNGHSPEAMVKAGITYKILTDQLGSVRLIINSTSGEIAQRIEYDDFGAILLDTNPGFQPFGFAGGLYDSDTKLIRFGARDYDPEVGRWTSKDPIRFGGGDTNLYGYVSNDPINWWDPTGLTAEDVRRALQIAQRVLGISGNIDWAFGKLGDDIDGRTNLNPFLPNSLTFNSSYSGELCEQQKRELLNTVFHELQHYRDGYWMSNYYEIFGPQSRVKGVSERHYNIYVNSNSLTENYIDEYLGR